MTCRVCGFVFSTSRRASPGRLFGEVKPTENFYYDGAGLHFVYNVYELASYADGTIEVCIPWPRPVCALPVAPVDGGENTP